MSLPDERCCTGCTRSVVRTQKAVTRMGLLDWLRPKKDTGMPQVLKAPWTRGDKGEPYCSTACRTKANKLTEAVTTTQKGKCFFCDSAVAYGPDETGAAAFALNGSIFAFCRNCRAKFKPFTSEHGRCFTCRKPYV